MDVLLCTASIWHMATISVDRYCFLRFPIRYRRTRTPVFVVAKIAFVWVVSIGICSPLAVAGFANPLSVYRDGRCAIAVPEFVIYGSIFAFFVPLVVMLASYALTVRTLTAHALVRRRGRSIIRKPSVPNAADQAEQPGNDTTPSDDSVTVDSTTTPKSSISRRLSNPQPDGQRSVESVAGASQDGVSLDRKTVKVVDDSKRSCDKGMCETPSRMARPRNGAADVHVQTNGDCSRYAVANSAPSAVAAVRPSNDEDVQRQQAADGPQRRRNTTTARCRDTDTGADDEAVTARTYRSWSAGSKPACAVSGPRRTAGHRHETAVDKRQSLSSQTRRIKRKATRVLGVVFVVFVVLWTPFFVLNIMSAACPRCVQSVSPTVWTVLVWLGWVSSFANPIIYTCFSPAFRSAFKHLLTCNFAASSARSRQRQLTTLLRLHRSRYDSQ